MGQEPRLQQDTEERTLTYDPEGLGSFNWPAIHWLSV